MKKIALLFSIVVLASGFCFAQTTGFTYQGKLGDAGAPANGSYDLRFTMWDAASGGNQQPQPSPVTVTRPGVLVANGGFTVRLDFGASFPGGDRYLEVSVRVHNADPNTPAYSTLSPRQRIGSTPYAIRSLSAATADNVSGIVSIANGGTGGATQNFVDLNSNQVIGGNKTFSNTLSGDVVNAATQYNISGNRVLSVTGVGSSVNSNTFAGVGAGASNTPSDTGGNNNSFVGKSAGMANTIGAQNSFFGSAAGIANTEGFNNSFFGYLAGQVNMTGSSNSFFGVNAGLSNSHDSNNTFVGANSDGASGITNATAIGSNAKVTQSNSLVLGNGVNVGIGISNPGAPLDVVGNINTRTQYNIGGNRVLSVTGVGSSVNSNTFAGVGAGASNTPSEISGGNNNSFVGNEAGDCEYERRSKLLLRKWGGIANDGGLQQFLLWLSCWPS